MLYLGLRYVRYLRYCTARRLQVVRLLTYLPLGSRYRQVVIDYSQFVYSVLLLLGDSFMYLKYIPY